MPMWHSLGVAYSEPLHRKPSGVGYWNRTSIRWGQRRGGGDLKEAWSGGGGDEKSLDLVYILKAEASRITVTGGSPAVLWEMTFRDMHRRILSDSGKFIREKNKSTLPQKTESRQAIGQWLPQILAKPRYIFLRFGKLSNLFPGSSRGCVWALPYPIHFLHLPGFWTLILSHLFS